MNPKPILIIRIPNYIPFDDCDGFDVSLKDIRKEYHVFTIQSEGYNDFIFECFNHNLSDIQLEELKEKLLIKTKSNE